MTTPNISNYVEQWTIWLNLDYSVYKANWGGTNIPMLDDDFKQNKDNNYKEVLDNIEINSNIEDQIMKIVSDNFDNIYIKWKTTVIWIDWNPAWNKPLWIPLTLKKDRIKRYNIWSDDNSEVLDYKKFNNFLETPLFGNIQNNNPTDSILIKAIVETYNEIVDYLNNNNVVKKVSIGSWYSFNIQNNKLNSYQEYVIKPQTTNVPYDVDSNFNEIINDFNSTGFSIENYNWETFIKKWDKKIATIKNWNFDDFNNFSNLITNEKSKDSGNKVLRLMRWIMYLNTFDINNITKPLVIDISKNNWDSKWVIIEEKPNLLKINLLNIDGSHETFWW